MSGNKTTFNIRSVTSKSFGFILDSFDYAVTFLFRIKQKFIIEFISSALMNALLSMRIKKIKLSFIPRSRGKILLSLRLNPMTSLEVLKNLKFTYIFKEAGRLITFLNIKKVKLTMFSKAIDRLVGIPFMIKKIKFLFTAQYGTAYALGQYDPQTLGTMDTQTLGALDFTAIP